MNIRSLLLLALAFAMASMSVHGKDLGVHGRLYGIAEDDLLELMLARAQREVDSGAWDKRIGKWRKQAKAQAARPRGVALPRSSQTASHLYDPSVVLEKPVTDSKGRVLHPAGTRANPLDYIRMTRTLVFIDGDDAEQLDWMLALTEDQPARYKVILTRGNVLDLAERLKRRLFFDQGQRYTEKLQIRSLPALVYQEGRYLRIDEVAIP